jgi:hypothetical protein
VLLVFAVKYYLALVTSYLGRAHEAMGLFLACCPNKSYAMLLELIFVSCICSRTTGCKIHANNSRKHVNNSTIYNIYTQILDPEE